mmetsp:Transcript_89673/g.158674  ORF Transcript_89673/g.158674 Transcript_89673/m.158674 type:complete len:499 (-) Transcript_89673:303-1799(-)
MSAVPSCTCLCGSTATPVKLGRLEGWVHSRLCEQCGRNIGRSSLRYHCRSCQANICSQCAHSMTTPASPRQPARQQLLMSESASNPLLPPQAAISRARSVSPCPSSSDFAGRGRTGGVSPRPAHAQLRPARSVSPASRQHFVADRGFMLPSSLRVMHIPREQHAQAVSPRNLLAAAQVANNTALLQPPAGSDVPQIILRTPSFQHEDERYQHSVPRSPTPVPRSPTPVQRSPTPVRSPNLVPRSPTPVQRSPTPVERSPTPVRSPTPAPRSPTPARPRVTSGTAQQSEQGVQLQSAYPAFAFGQQNSNQVLFAAAMPSPRSSGPALHAATPSPLSSGQLPLSSARSPRALPSAIKKQRAQPKRASIAKTVEWVFLDDEEYWKETARKTMPIRPDGQSKKYQGANMHVQRVPPNGMSMCGPGLNAPFQMHPSHLGMQSLLPPAHHPCMPFQAANFDPIHANAVPVMPMPWPQHHSNAGLPLPPLPPTSWAQPGPSVRAY